MDSTPIDISFIIPHKGRENLLRDTLTSIAAQDYPKSKIEVIIVTQNPTLTGETLSALSDIQVKVINRPVAETISMLRNYGVLQSSGRYLAFLDADIKLRPNWIAAMFQQIQTIPDCVMTSAVQECEDNAPALEIMRTGLSNAAIDTEVRFLPGRNLFLTRETFDRVGGFPEHLVTCEDYYFTDSVSRLGKLYYSSSSRYVHLGEDKELGEMFKKEIWRGQSNLQSIRGRQIPLSELPSFLVPIWIAFFSAASLVMLLFAIIPIFALCLILALLPIIIYSLRLHNLLKGRLGFGAVLKFYLVYFPARIIGTFIGLFKVINV